MAVAGLATCVRSGSVSAAPERKSLDGWGPFKFSMSLGRAMAATKGTAHLGAPEALEYPCIIGGRPFTAIAKFTDDEARISYINLVENGMSKLDDQALSAEYIRLIDTLAAQYGNPDSKGPPVSDFDRSSGHIGPEASTTFKFADGGSISVLEAVGWLPHLIVRYTPAPPHELF